MTLPAPLDGQSDEYRTWRLERLRATQLQTDSHAEINLSAGSSSAERNATLRQITAAVQTHGYGRYRFDTPAPRDLEASLRNLKSLATALGLERADRGVMTDENELAVLQDHGNGPLGRFRAYSNAPLNWHTDGYYNHIDEPVRTFTLHCVNQAPDGGALTLFDPQLLLIRLYSDAPDIPGVLSAPDAVTLPANTDAEGHNRPDRTVPVFFAHPDETLGMRFTTRTRNIQFRDDLVADAMNAVTSMIRNSSDLHRTILLQPGEGLIARNVLHARSAFSDSKDQPPRQIVRGRYLDTPDARNIPCCT